MDFSNKNIEIIQEKSDTKLEIVISQILENKEKGIRTVYIGSRLSYPIYIAMPKLKVVSALVYDAYVAEYTRRHNNTFVLVIDSQLVPEHEWELLIKTFADQSFEGGRHQRRISYITEEKESKYK